MIKGVQYQIWLFNELNAKILVPVRLKLRTASNQGIIDDSIIECR